MTVLTICFGHVEDQSVSLIFAGRALMMLLPVRM